MQLMDRVVYICAGRFLTPREVASTSWGHTEDSHYGEHILVSTTG